MESINELKREAYEAKQEHKKESYERLADKNHKESELRYNQSTSMARAIPFGQPLHPNHYSYKSDVAFRNKIHTNMKKSVEADEKANYYEEKLERVNNNKVISSDDPEAIAKLKSKLEKLESDRTNIKEHNKKARKEGKPSYPGYVLSNLGGKIKSVKDRIVRLEKQAEQIKAVDEGAEQATCKFEGGYAIENLVYNRLQLIFDEKPEEATRTILKSNGFRWSPKAGAWQRLLNGNARYAFKRIVNSL